MHEEVKHRGHRWVKGESGNPKGSWVKGQSGNPKGRPRKDYSITSLAKEMLDQPADERFLSESDYGKTWRQAIAKALLVGALKLNPGITKELLDRLEGKPVQLIGGETGGAITLRVVYDDRNKA